MEHIVVLTGAGISEESGISTFRGANGLWEGHDISQVATPEGWEKDPALVLEFYNQRRKQLKTVSPNSAHLDLVSLEKEYTVSIVTQNVDDLHERSGSSSVLHLHGELNKVRSQQNTNDSIPWFEDLNLGQCCSMKKQLRPDIVWFGEEVPALPAAIELVQSADILLIIGTSLQVYPAANLLNYVSDKATTYFIDPNPAYINKKNVTVIAQKATVGMKTFLKKMLEKTEKTATYF